MPWNGMTTKKATKKAFCHKCEYHQKIVQKKHSMSKCCHPEAEKAIADTNPLACILELFGFKRIGVIDREKNICSIDKPIGIVVNLKGVEKGLFCWPYNFDPFLLKKCDGLKEKNKKEK